MSKVKDLVRSMLNLKNPVEKTTDEIEKKEQTIPTQTEEQLKVEASVQTEPTINYAELFEKLADEIDLIKEQILKFQSDKEQMSAQIQKIAETPTGQPIINIQKENVDTSKMTTAQRIAFNLNNL